MAYTPTITVDEVIDALADFLQPFCPGAQIVRAQVNRVPQPPSPCVVLTEVLQLDLETPSNTHRNDDDETDISTPTRVDIQVDFYGSQGGDFCRAVKSVFRSEYAPAQFPDGIKPLYCSDGIQAPLVTGERQYESRWTITASLQYNPLVAVPQESANELSANIDAPVDLS